MPLKMSNLMKLAFKALDTSGANYFSYILDANIQLDAIGLGNKIKSSNNTSTQLCTKTMIFGPRCLLKQLTTEI